MQCRRIWTALGGQKLHIIWSHIIPNILGIVIIYSTLMVPQVILTETFLSWIGLGIQAPKASWGNLMVDLKASNAKLRDRAARIISRQCDLSREDALALLGRTGGAVKPALVMAKCCVDVAEANRLLAEHHQRLRPILGPPR